MEIFVFMEDGIKMVYIDRYKNYCYFIFAILIINYKNLVFIIIIKLNVQYFLYHILLEKPDCDMVIRFMDLKISSKQII